MRVLVVGGAGAMGRQACRVVAGFEDVERIVVTDLSADVATAFAAELGRGAVGVGLDLTDPVALRGVIQESDVVVNTTGPFYRLGDRILAAAIEAGCHYLDICDDWEPTLAMLALDERARAAGVTAIVGMGASPGISNLLAVLAMREVDATDRLVTGWCLDGARPPRRRRGFGGGGIGRGGRTGPRAAMVHGIREATGAIAVVRAGATRQERPLRPELIDYPGVGRRRALTFGHPEPVTLARTFPHLRDSVNVTYGARLTLAVLRSMQLAVDHRVLTTDRAASWAERAEALVPGGRPEALFTAGALPPVFALAEGVHQGSPATVGVALAGFPGTTMSVLTGTPVAVALQSLGAGGITRRGVFPPEAVIDPAAFMAAFAGHCLGHPDPEELVLVTRSWDPAVAEHYRQGVGAVQARLRR